MVAEYLFVAGLALCLLSFVSFVRAYVDSRLSRLGIVMVLAGAAMIGWAVYSAPDAISFANVEQILLSVVGRIIN